MAPSETHKMQMSVRSFVCPMKIYLEVLSIFNFLSRVSLSSILVLLAYSVGVGQTELKCFVLFIHLLVSMWRSLSLSPQCAGPGRHPQTDPSIPCLPSSLPAPLSGLSANGSPARRVTRGHVITAANQDAEKGVAAPDSCRAPLYTV